MKILTVIGARPQFVKAAAVSREIKKHPEISEVIVHTGQHFDASMSDIFFDEMEIPRPDYNLNIHGLTHGAMTGQMLEKLDGIISSEKPDFVLVYGDTNSTLAGALSAAKLHCRVAHVEAGLRSFNMNMPEEINRILVDRISHTLFCPTETAIRNLENEGYRNFGIKIVRSGDVMYDAALYYAEKIKTRPSFLEKTGLAGRRFILATIHRAENTDDIEKLSSIIKALDTVSESENVILPIHPRTKKILADNGIIPRFTVIDPVGYFEMLELLQNCSAVMTDSGGVQKEAYFFKKQCITLREETEWVELIENGFNTIVGSDFDKIVSAYKKLSEKDPDFGIQLYGNGNAAGEIVTNLLENCGE